MNYRRGAGAGSVFLLLIFSVLCLTIFALLTLCTARSEANLAKKAADSVKSFYGADTNAEYVYSELMYAISIGNKPEIIQDTKIEYPDGYMQFISPVSDGRIIAVLLSSDGTIIQWKETDTKDWTPDESISVLGKK